MYIAALTFIVGSKALPFALPVQCRVPSEVCEAEIITVETSTAIPLTAQTVGEEDLSSNKLVSQFI